MAGGSISAAATVMPTIVNNYFQFVLGQNTYKEVIQVVTNGAKPVTLDPSTLKEFCVGQYLQFQLVLDPMTLYAPPLTCSSRSYARWTLPGKYVNRMTPYGVLPQLKMDFSAIWIST